MSAREWTEQSGTDKSGEWCSGCPRDWAWYTPTGGYYKNRGFFELHWEVHPEHNPEAIRFHVQAPRYSDDPRLNDLKHDVVRAITASSIEKHVRMAGFDFAWGRLTKDSHIQRNKCTEPFRVVLKRSQMVDSHEANIRLVHGALGARIDELLESFRGGISEAIERAAI